MGGNALIVSVLKILEHIERPTNGIYFNAGFSYPSGHSAGCIVFGGVLAYFAWRHWQSTRSKSLISLGLGLIVGAVGFDRVYLNVHWFSDVIGGWLVGAFWLFFIILIFRHFYVKRKFQYEKFNLIINIVFVLAVVTSILIVVLSFFGFSMFS
jgi:undecaprenyl-diphosphatase